MVVTAPPNPRSFDCPNRGSLIPPERGSPCNLDPSASCKYDKECCCATCVDRFTATCKFDVWEVVEVAIDCLPGPCPPTLPPGSLETAAPTGELTFTCPNQDSIIPPTQGSECNVNQAQLCKYDQTCCCGSCVDRFYCSCVAGQWSCTELAFDCLPCVDPVVTCPVPTDTPYPNGECTLPLDKVCGYGEVCCCDNCVVETSCQCNFGTWLCSTLDLPCTETCPPPGTKDVVDVATTAPPIDPVTSCPIPLDMDLSINGTMCELPDATECNYGKICCCDSCIERFYCSCNGGVWICSELAFRCGPCDVTTTECPIIEDPSISPVPVGSCNVPQTKECTYGKTCCCDNCIDEFYCHCESGTWSCAQLAFGCLGPCPPPENGQPCEPTSVIESGVFECCGSISPQWVCRCGIAGTYECTALFPPGVVCACAPPPDELFLLDSPPVLVENTTILP
ncbi:hypothetical protein MHU86_17739 [Fragilaria crotonensis]|nr:hypothetical protein MHU86_17739 [Fragilaria crotonensis]